MARLPWNESPGTGGCRWFVMPDILSQNIPQAQLVIYPVPRWSVAKSVITGGGLRIDDTAQTLAIKPFRAET